LKNFLYKNLEKKIKQNAKNVIVIVIAINPCILIGMMGICVLVEVVNIKYFMRCNYGKIYAITRMLMQKIVWFCMAIKNKINNKFGEKKCTKV
tara:strand:+ start:722 stop:1000 length:279 start_codon:yes stop_codon:yes gene_type:complete